MIARPQADLLNMLPVTQVTPLAAKALEGGMNLRFDAALLEAAKAMRDSAPQEPELALVPRVQQAFENALSELAQKPVDQLKAMVEAPTAAKPEIAAIVANVAQAAGLNADERSALMDLVPLALPRVLDYKAQIQVPGTPAISNITNGGVQPGPQGGTPERVASPVDTDTSPQPGFSAQLPEPDNAPSRDAASAAGAGLLLSQLPQAPVIVSTRTDDGSGKSSALNQVSEVSNSSTGQILPPPAALAPLAPQAVAGAPELAPSATVVAAPQGRVIQVSVSQQNVPGPAPVPALPRPADQTVAPQPQAAAQPDVNAPQGVRAPAPRPQPGSDAALQGAVLNTDAPAPAPQTDVIASPNAQPQGQAPAARALPADPNATAIKLPVDLDVQFQDPFQPLAVVPGSELTLQEDGSWTQPVPALAGKPVAPMPQGIEVPAPSQAGAPQAPLPQVPAAPNAVQPTDVLPEPSAQISAQAPVSTPPAAPQDLAPTPASPVLTQSPAPVQAPRAPQPETAVRAADGADESQPALADAFQAPADERVQARRSADEGSFTSLANPNLGGQDPLKALAQQTARDYAVRESVFKQVYEALREAPGTDNGRMLIRLKPAELGEVHIDLTLVNGKLSARLVASQAEVRDAFVRDLPGFKAGLESQGLAVRDISVAVRAGIAGQQDQPAPQQQPDPQAWWRELPRQDQTPGLGTPASAGYTTLSVTDQRFSALA